MLLSGTMVSVLISIIKLLKCILNRKIVYSLVLFSGLISPNFKCPKFSKCFLARSSIKCGCRMNMLWFPFTKTSPVDLFFMSTSKNAIECPPLKVFACTSI